MKKIATLLLLCGLCYSSAFAQQNYISGIHLGVNGSIFSSNIFNEHNYGSTDLYNHDITLGFSGGLNASISVNDIHEFQLEFIYSFQGQNWSDEQGGQELRKSVSFQYFRVPVIYKYKMPFDAYNPNSPSYYFLTGFFASSLNSANLKYTADGAEVPFAEAVSPGNINDIQAPAAMMDLYLPFDFGSVVGIGFEFPLAGDLSFTAESRLDVSLLDHNGLRYRFPSTTKGYRPSHNVLWGLKLGLVYNLYL